MNIFPGNQSQPSNPHSRYMGDSLINDSQPTNARPQTGPNIPTSHSAQKSIFGDNQKASYNPQPFSYPTPYENTPNQSFTGQSRQNTDPRQSNIKGYQNPITSNSNIFGGQPRPSATSTINRSQIIGRPSNELPGPKTTQQPYAQRLADSNFLEQVVGLITQPDTSQNMMMKKSTVVKPDIMTSMTHTVTVPYFVGKRVVVTGASSGVGRAVAAW